LLVLDLAEVLMPHLPCASMRSEGGPVIGWRNPRRIARGRLVDLRWGKSEPAAGLGRPGARWRRLFSKPNLGRVLPITTRPCSLYFSRPRRDVRQRAQPVDAGIRSRTRRGRFLPRRPAAVSAGS
jgi:hypothetical protein